MKAKKKLFQYLATERVFKANHVTPKTINLYLYYSLKVTKSQTQKAVEQAP